MSEWELKKHLVEAKRKLSRIHSQCDSLVEQLWELDETLDKAHASIEEVEKALVEAKTELGEMRVPGPCDHCGELARMVCLDTKAGGRMDLCDECWNKSGDLASSARAPNHHAVDEIVETGGRITCRPEQAKELCDAIRERGAFHTCVIHVLPLEQCFSSPRLLEADKETDHD